LNCLSPEKHSSPKTPLHLRVLGINGCLSALPMTGQRRGFTNLFTTLLTSHRNNVASLRWLGIPSGCCSKARRWYRGCCRVLGAIIDPIMPWYIGAFQWMHQPLTLCTHISLGFSPESCHVRGHPRALAINSKTIAPLVSCAVGIPGRGLSPGKHLQQHCLPDTAGLTAVTPPCT